MLTIDYKRLDARPGMTMLDLGCGSGRHTSGALLHELECVSVDLDEAALGQTTAEVDELRDARVLPGRAMVRCARSDARRLPFSDGAFDRIIVSEVLEHISDDAVALREVFRVLRSGGLAAFSVPRWWPERICWLLSDEYHETEGGHVRIYSGPTLRARLRAAGFHVTDSHHAHALHSPYWWLRCAVGVNDEAEASVALYKRFLEWDIMRKPRPARLVEHALNPLLGKSLVVYARKPTRERSST